MRKVLLAGGVLLLAVLIVLSLLAPPNLSIPIRADLVISGVTIINPAHERLPDHSIVIRAGRILEVRPQRSGDPGPICEGCYAVPGLIDVHVHTPPRIALGNQELFSLLYLAHGVTTLRDVGASDASVAGLATRLNEGRLVGPRMFRCGPVLDGDPPSWPVAEAVGEPETGSQIVDGLAAKGVDCIKVYNELNRETFDAIAAAARRNRLPLVGHVPHAVGLRAVRDLEIQHMTGVPYLSRPRPPFGSDIRDEDLLALSDEDIEDALEIALRQNVAFTPTLANFSLRLTASDAKTFPPTTASRFLPAYWAGAWDVLVDHPAETREIERRLRAVPRMRVLVARASKKGIDILAGTDTLMPWVVPGDALHLEMAELELALGGAEAALAAATTVNARHLAPGELGVIAPGARADVLLLNRDPTRDLSALRDWKILFADGRRYERSTIDDWLDAYQRHFHGGLYQNTMDVLVPFAINRFVYN